MRYLDLFTGIAGISRCVQRCEGVKCAAYVEVHPPARQIIQTRMSTGDIQHAPILSDVRGVKGDDIGPINMVCGGFPCQDISVAGAGKGLAGERSCLVFEMIRLLRETGARWFFAENVGRFRTNGFSQVKEVLEREGYAVRHAVLTANECGMRHRRRRIFILGRRVRSSASGARTAPPLIYCTPEPDARTVSRKNAQWRNRIHGLGNACSPVQCDKALRRLLGYPSPGTTWDEAWDASENAVSPRESSPGGASESVPLSCPTPIASDARGGAGPNQRKDGRCTAFSLARWIRVRPNTNTWGLSCTEQEYADRARGVYLSPEWTEWLMGFPIGWTSGE